jgi:hypothetical protein
VRIKIHRRAQRIAVRDAAEHGEQSGAEPSQFALAALRAADDGPVLGSGIGQGAESGAFGLIRGHSAT